MARARGRRRGAAGGAGRPVGPGPPAAARLIPLVSGLTGARRRVVVAGLVAVGAVGALYAALILAGAGRDAGTATLTEALYYVVGFGAAGLCVARAWLVAPGRSAWLLLSAGILAWLVADTCGWLVYHDDAPVPSPLDAGYLAFYPASYAAIFALARAELARLPSSVRLDGLVGGLAVAGVVAEFAIRPIVHGIGGSA